MYPHQNTVTRHPGLSLSPQNFSVPGPPQYSDFPGYHPHHLGLGTDPQQAGPGAGWSPAYPPPPAPARDDWASHHYAAAVGGPPAAPGHSGPVGPTLSFSPPEFPGQLPASLNPSAGQLSPGSPRRRNPYDWIRTSAPPGNPSKSRTCGVLTRIRTFESTCSFQTEICQLARAPPVNGPEPFGPYGFNMNYINIKIKHFILKIKSHFDLQIFFF